MRRSLGCISFVLASVFWGQGAWSISNGDDPDKEIANHEQRRAEAICTHLEVAKEIFADDFLGLEPGGTEYDKAAAEAKEKNLNARECHLDAVKIRTYGETVKVAYGAESAVISTKREEHPSCLVWTHEWLKRDKKWQIIAAQDSALPCK